MAEWLNAPVLKTDVGESLPWVRIPPPPPIISFLLICLKICAFRANILYRTTYFTTYSDNFFAEIFEIKNYITYGKPRLENGRYVVDATIPFEMREKLGWGKQKRLYLKTNNYEQAVANLADKKVELEKLATDMLAEFDPLVSKAEELYLNNHIDIDPFHLDHPLQNFFERPVLLTCQISLPPEVL